MNLLAQEMGAFIIKKIIMNKTMTYIASLLLCIGSVSCGNNTKQQSQNTAEEQAIVSTGMEVDSLLANADSLAEKNITVQGICTHTCIRTIQPRLRKQYCRSKRYIKRTADR